MKSTELNLIPFFVAVYEEQSLSKAASRLGVSQPAVSKALKRLREVYDDALFHRSPSGVTPTAFAVDIYPALSASYKNFTSTLSASRDFDASVSKRIFSVACVTIISYQLMPELVSHLSELAPDIGLEIHPLFTEDLESDLRLQRYDLVIDIKPTNRTSLKVELLFRDSLLVLARKGHPRLQGSITKEQFLQEKHIAVSRWHSRSSIMSEFDVPLLAERQIVYRSPGVIEALPVVAMTDYLALFPQTSFNLFEHNYPIQLLPLEDVELPLEICMLWHHSRTTDPGHKWLRQQIAMISKSVHQSK